MTPEFCLKLGVLLGSIDEFCLRVEANDVEQPDIDRIKSLAKDVQKKFFECQAVRESRST